MPPFRDGQTGASGLPPEAPPADATEPVLPLSAREAYERGVPGWPARSDELPPPPGPVLQGRGGAQKIPRPLNARPGGAAPWADLAPARRRPTVADVKAALATSGPPMRSERESAVPPARASAVLVPLYDDPDGAATVVLTRRTWGLRTHQGEVSFPGGRVDPGESPLDGALREAKEEIDLEPSLVEVVGELDHIATVASWSFIVPFVASLPERPELQPSPAEVEAIRHVPLAELLSPGVYREEIWTFPDGDRRAINFFDLVGDTVWGATASLLRQLLGVTTGTLARGGLEHPGRGATRP